MKPLDKEEAISRAIAAWRRDPRHPRPCRTWCTVEPEGPTTLQVQLRDDARELLGIYRVGPRQVAYLTLETDVAQGQEWGALNHGWMDHACEPGLSAPEAIHKAILAWTWDLNRPTPLCGLCDASGEESGSYLVCLWGKSQALLAVFRVNDTEISFLERETAMLRGLAWAIQREEEAS